MIVFAYILSFQITLYVEDVTSAFKDDESLYDEKETYILGYSPSILSNKSKVRIEINLN